MMIEGMVTVPKCLHISSTAGVTSQLKFISIPTCSCLSCGISVGKKVFGSICDCGITCVDVWNIVYQYLSLWGSYQVEVAI